MSRFRIVWGFALIFGLLPAWTRAQLVVPDWEQQAVHRDGLDPATAGLKTVVKGAKTTGICDSEETKLCLNDGRFSVEVTWVDFEGNAGSGTAAVQQVENSGLFWFFDDGNWELLVKILDGCGANGHFWVYSAATTNVEYVLKVTDHMTGIAKEYHNPLGHASAAVTDSLAFPTCQVSEHTANVFLFANPSTLTVGESARITIIARDGNGQPPVGPQRVRLVADLGDIADEVLTDDLGEAEAIYTAGELPGFGRVSAFLGDSPPAEVGLSIQERERTQLLVFASPSILPTNGEATITLIARDADGFSPLAGERIRLVADLGEIESEVFTDSNGEAVVQFRAGSLPGFGHVTAILPGTDPRTVGIDILSVPEGLLLTVDRHVIQRGVEETVQLEVRVSDALGNPFSGALVQFFSELGTLDTTLDFTNSQGVASSTLVVQPFESEGIPEGDDFTVTAIVVRDGVVLQDAFVITVF